QQTVEIKTGRHFGKVYLHTGIGSSFIQVYGFHHPANSVRNPDLIIAAVGFAQCKSNFTAARVRVNIYSSGNFVTVAGELLLYDGSVGSIAGTDTGRSEKAQKENGEG